MTKLLDRYINSHEAFAEMTDYEKWEYREEVIAGMKQFASDTFCILASLPILIFMIIVLGE